MSLPASLPFGFNAVGLASQPTTAGRPGDIIADASGAYWHYVDNQWRKLGFVDLSDPASAAGVLPPSRGGTGLSPQQTVDAGKLLRVSPQGTAYELITPQALGTLIRPYVLTDASVLPSHTHTANQIVVGGGTIAPLVLGNVSGAAPPLAQRFLRGDSQWVELTFSAISGQLLLSQLPSHQHSANDIQSGVLPASVVPLQAVKQYESQLSINWTQITNAPQFANVAPHTHPWSDVGIVNNVPSRLPASRGGLGISPSGAADAYKIIQVNASGDGYEYITRQSLVAALNVAPASHTHSVSDINASGTRTASTYLRGNGQWASLDASHLTSGSVAHARLSTTYNQVDGKYMVLCLSSTTSAPVWRTLSYSDLHGAPSGGSNVVPAHSHGWSDVGIVNNQLTPLPVSRGGIGTPPTQSNIGYFLRVGSTLDNQNQPNAIVYVPPSSVVSLIGAAPSNHTHTWSQVGVVNGLETALPASRGGLGFSLSPNNAGKLVRVNSSSNGYELVNPNDVIGGGGGGTLPTLAGECVVYTDAQGQLTASNTLLRIFPNGQGQTSTPLVASGGDVCFVFGKIVFDQNETNTSRVRIVGGNDLPSVAPANEVLISNGKICATSISLVQQPNPMASAILINNTTSFRPIAAGGLALFINSVPVTAWQLITDQPIVSYGVNYNLYVKYSLPSDSSRSIYPIQQLIQQSPIGQTSGPGPSTLVLGHFGPSADNADWCGRIILSRARASGMQSISYSLSTGDYIGEIMFCTASVFANPQISLSSPLCSMRVLSANASITKSHAVLEIDVKTSLSTPHAPSMPSMRISGNEIAFKVRDDEASPPEVNTDYSFKILPRMVCLPVLTSTSPVVSAPGVGSLTCDVSGRLWIWYNNTWRRLALEP